MKLISCHHIKKRPPKGGDNSGKLIWQDDTNSCCFVTNKNWKKTNYNYDEDDALIDAESLIVEPSASLKCCHLVRCPRSIYHFKRVLKRNVLLSLMCLIIISDFHHHQQQLNQQIAKKCAQKDLEEEIELPSNNSRKLGLKYRQQQQQGNQHQYEYTPLLKNKLAFSQELRSAIRTRTTLKDKYQDENEYDDYHKSTCLENNKLRWSSLLLINLLMPKNGLVLFAHANADANRLYEDLMMTYNRIVRPVQNNTDRVVVKLALKLSQLIDVNLKNQMMTTNVWLNQEWSDYKLKWDPSEYGGIEDINVPAEQIWLPDIVLYNSAEGYFAVSIMTKAKVRFDGHVTWNPPAIFRSSCQIDITYFPFDSQNCHLKFGSWTYGTKIDLRHINDTEALVERGTDLSEYYQNVEWDIMQATAIRNVITYTCCPNDFYPDVTFNFELRRKPLFYTVNLIAPCIAITILSFAVFYLPSDSGEKVTLTISILVSLIFFLSVLIETIPSTSLAMPLLGKYLVFTMILITVSVCATVCVLNIHFRTPSTHSMPAWVKRWCIEILPRYLFMNVPQYQSSQQTVNPILPEQLIYLHNQACAAQQRQQHHQNQNEQLQQQQHQTTDINWPSAKIAAEYIKANHSSEFGQNSFVPASSSGSLTTNYNHQSNTILPATTTEFRQLDAGKLKKLDPKQPNKAVASAGVASLNISPSSLFLPYLQSEAARRLQMQRSRSSERDRSTSEHQVASTTSAAAAAAGSINTNSNNNNSNFLPNKTTTTSTTNNKSCDINQFSPPSQQQPLLAAQSNQRNNINTNNNSNNTTTTIDMQSSSIRRDGSTTKNRNNNNSSKRKSSRTSSNFNNPSTSSRSRNEVQNKSNQREKLFKSDKRSLIKRIFAPKRTSVITEEEDNSNPSSASDIEASRTTILGKVTRRRSSSKGNQLGALTTSSQTATTTTTGKSSHQLQHDTSSSFENDYQYHNHFQARASICSTNIWRVGPSRRCSVAVPTNYPTFYQPALAQIAHPSASTSQQQQTGFNSNQTLSTLSGCVANHNHHTTGYPHHHHHHKGNLAPSLDSSDSSTRSGAIDALVKATTTKLTLPQSGLAGGINRPSTSESNQQHTTQNSDSVLSGDQEMKKLSSSFSINNRINKSDNIPNNNHPLLKEQYQNQLKTLPSSNLGHHYRGQSKPIQPDSAQIPTPTPPPPPPLPASSPIPNNSMLFQGQHQLILNPSDLQRQQQQQQHGGLLILNHGSTFNPARQNNQQQQQPMSHRAQSNQHVTLENQGNNFVDSGSRIGIPSYSNQFGQQPIVYRMIPRSRSTDYRLCQHAAGKGNVATNGNENFYYATGNIDDRSHLIRKDLSNNSQTMRGGGRFNVMQQTSTASHQQQQQRQQQVVGDRYLLQGPQTIGRALGQAYMQRLERQPTIYSWHSTNSQNRPSRSFQRAYLKPLGGPQEMSQFNCQNGTQLENMRRSKSQNSLNGRAQFDCDQCNFAAVAVAATTTAEQPWQINNNNDERIMRGHHQACSYDLSGQQSSSQHSGGRSLKCLGCCSSLSVQHNHQQQHHRHHHHQSSGPQISCCSSFEHFRCNRNNYEINNQGTGSLDQCQLSHDQRRQISDCSPNSFKNNKNYNDGHRLQRLNTLAMMKLFGDVDKAIQNAMFIAQHIDNLDEFESVKENWKYIAMVIDRIFLIVFLFACIVGTVTIFAMVPWSYYTTQKPIDLRLTRLMALNLTNASGILMGDDPYSRSCRDF